MLDVAPLEESFEQTINQAKLLIRAGQVDEGWQMLDTLEEESAPYFSQLPPSIRYLVPYTRGRALIQRNQAEAAKALLLQALDVAGTDREAIARTHNLLGVVYYETGHPDLARKSHLISNDAIARHAVRDINFQLSVYHNLANAYWALNDFPHAIGVYRRALRVFKDLDAPDRMAPIYWGISSCYKAQKNYRYARLNINRALKIYQRTGEVMSELSMHINMAEIQIEEGKLPDAKRSLKRAHAILTSHPHSGLFSFVYRYFADVARKEGDLEAALQHAELSVDYAQKLIDEGQEGEPTALWVVPARAYAEALQGAALVHEAMARTDDADRLFLQAIAYIERTTIEETRTSLHLAYGDVLEARGDYQKASFHFRQAASPRSGDEIA